MKNTIIALAASAIALGSVNAQSWTELINPDGTSAGPFDVGGGVFVEATLTGNWESFAGSSIRVLGNDSATFTFNVIGGTADLAGRVTSFAGNGFELISFTPDATFTDITNNGQVIGNTFTGDPNLTNPQSAANYSLVGVSGFQATITNNFNLAASQGFLAPTVTNFTAVPEPSSALLLGLGAFGLLGRRKR